jgi:hypothetical protein
MRFGCTNAGMDWGEGEVTYRTLFVILSTHVCLMTNNTDECCHFSLCAVLLYERLLYLFLLFWRGHYVAGRKEHTSVSSADDSFNFTRLVLTLHQRSISYIFMEHSHIHSPWSFDKESNISVRLELEFQCISSPRGWERHGINKKS